MLQLSILYVPIGKLAKPVPFQGTDTGSNPVGGTNMALWSKGMISGCLPEGGVSITPRVAKNVTSYDSGRVVLVNKPFFLQVEDKRTCVYDLVVELA